MHTHLHPYARRIYVRAFRTGVSGFENRGLHIRRGRATCDSCSSGQDFACGSFGFHLTVDTLAVRLPLPPVGCVEDLHLKVSAPCRAHK